MTDQRIAVIGMAVRLPGAEDSTDLSSLLRTDTIEVGSVPPARWAKERYLGDGPHRGTHERGAFLPDPFAFDHAAFGLSESDARLLDPQQRVMLEVGAAALEDSGYLGVRRRLAAGVYIGARMNSYGFDHGRGVGAGEAEDPVAAALWGRSQNFAAAWLSDRLDLSGPSLVVDTACSSSLTAVWLACQGLLAGSAEVAVVGAVDLLIDPLTYVLLSRTGALSADGLCRTFDERADGYVPGEGAAALVLKPLAAAERDGDRVLAAISGWGANNDGATMGVTTPNLDAQIELLRSVYSTVDPASVQYIEAHGTGTAIGDPIEVRALTEVFGAHGVTTGSVALGSVKRRIGHLHSAAGMAGLAKLITCLTERRLPATAVERPNPRLRLATSPFHLPTEHGPWPEVPVRRAGISGFGFGGTNVHLVLDGIDHTPTPGTRQAEVLPISAHTPEALRELAAQWTGFLTANANDLADICATARLARPRRAETIAVSGVDSTQLAAALRSWLLENPTSSGPIVVREPDAATPPSWLIELDRAVPEVAAVLDRFEAAVGLPLERFAGPLVPVSAMVAQLVALRANGIPEQALDVPSKWTSVAAACYGRADLEQALAEALTNSNGHPTTTPDGFDLGARLRDDDVAAVFAAAVAHAHNAGHTVDWTAFQADAPWHKRTLPAVQATGRSLNLPEPLRSAEPGSALKVEPTPDGYTFSRLFGPAETPIAQHSVYRTAMLPGVGWFDFLRQGVEAAGEVFHGVDDLLFHRPLIPEAPSLVVCQVKGSAFTVTDESGAAYVTGALAGSTPEPVTVPVRDLLDQCGPLHAGSRVYRWLRRIGYTHGRYYRNISWVAGIPGGGTLARIEGGRQRALNPDDVALFPGLLDSVTIAAIDPDNPVFGADDASAFIPLSVGRTRWHGPLEQAAYVRTEVAFWNHEACRVTQLVTDADGRVLLEFGDISSKRVPLRAFSSDGALPAAEPAQPKSVEPQPLKSTVERPRDTLSWFLAESGIDGAHADTEFLAAGFDSVGLVELSDRLSRDHGLSLYPTVFFEYPTPRGFAEFLESESFTVPQNTQVPQPTLEPEPLPTPPARAITVEAPEPQARDIAIVGAAIRVPTAHGLDEFWDLLRTGRDTVGPVPGERRGSRPDGQASFLDQVDLFDPAPFRISAREAPLIDPQARVVYETIWEALEHGGRMGQRARSSRTGLWIGYSHDHYHEERARHGIAAGRGLGLEAMIPNRLSYLMDWHGPSVLVNTLCSSTLVALHTAVQHLRSGDIDTAVVAGVHAAISPEYFESMRELAALSPRSRCRAFDASADGFTPGEGAVAVVLRRHTDAVAAGDDVLALVKGIAVNHGGRTTRYSAPSPRAQREVITAALADAGVTPEGIGLLEAHGTGTSLGDPIEVEGASAAWRAHTDRTQFCALGSLKSNVGHLEPAAGLAGVLKVLLAMRHGQVPPTLHVSRPNDHIRFESTPFYLADRAHAWPRGDEPRRGAVSAFGMGGVNAHVILEEAPATPITPAPARTSHVVRVSGASERSVRELAARYAAHLAPDTPLVDFAHTANTGRAEHRFRVAVRGADAGELAAALTEVASGRTPVARLTTTSPPAAFLFTGQGSQYAGMGRELLDAEPVFREAIDECAELLRPHTTTPLLDLLHGAASEQLTDTANAQVAIVATQVALLRLLAAWGIRPDLVAGHSVGELTALHAAGAITLPDLMRLTAHRGRLMQGMPSSGGMAVVHADPRTVHSALAGHPEVEVAAYNSPDNTTVAGPHAALAAFREACAHRTTALTVSHAFHSAAMTGAVTAFAEAVAGTDLTEPTIPVVSTLSGDWHTSATVTDPGTWARALTSPVRWSDAVGRLHAAGARTYWEIGPAPVLVALARANLAGVDNRYEHVLRRGHDPVARLHAAVVDRYLGGDPVDWTATTPGRARAIPAYAFDRAPHWVPTGPSAQDPHAPDSSGTSAQYDPPRLIDGVPAMGRNGHG
ncbi:type I polyketide synthase [Actinokineospora diospyrosa]|uniref:Acyl transferase domain-containing protein n=1 Tax=Actinokineospora diospyrosa TaxID=103728 RepID=A0ABT1IC17_9PSEU|nr:type I polyketide synthase [Actinokineospora diospyrosa]MCP2270178.1 Acyl transferase domain-containing protein [Actinokineospora diospyrosa]